MVSVNLESTMALRDVDALRHALGGQHYMTKGHKATQRGKRVAQASLGTQAANLMPYP